MGGALALVAMIAIAAICGLRAAAAEGQKRAITDVALEDERN